MTAKELIQRAVARGDIIAPTPPAVRDPQSLSSNERRSLAQKRIWTPERRAEHSAWMRQLSKIRGGNIRNKRQPTITNP